MSANEFLAIGGGHGLATVLRALTDLEAPITAVVTVADNGGSSGKLRRQYSIPAPGDVRRCLSALAAPTSQLGACLENRFQGGELDGHPLGNLILASMTASAGSLQSAIDELAELMKCSGTVLAATDETVDLVAQTPDGTIVGQVEIEQHLNEGGTVSVVSLSSETATPNRVVESIERAEVILLGPGSLYTSALAATLTTDMASRLNAATAKLIYVANVTDSPLGPPASDPTHQLRALGAHGIKPDFVLAPSETMQGATGDDIVLKPLLATNEKRHDEKLLATAISAISH